MLDIILWLMNSTHQQLLHSLLVSGLTLPEDQTKSLCNFEFIQRFCSMPGSIREKLLSYREVCFQFSVFYFYPNPYRLREEYNSNPADAFSSILW